MVPEFKQVRACFRGLPGGSASPLHLIVWHSLVDSLTETRRFRLTRRLWHFLSTLIVMLSGMACPRAYLRFSIRGWREHRSIRPIVLRVGTAAHRICLVGFLSAPAVQQPAGHRICASGIRKTNTGMDG